MFNKRRPLKKKEHFPAATRYKCSGRKEKERRARKTVRLVIRLQVEKEDLYIKVHFFDEQEERFYEKFGGFYRKNPFYTHKKCSVFYFIDSWNLRNSQQLYTHRTYSNSQQSYNIDQVPSTLDKSKFIQRVERPQLLMTYSAYIKKRYLREE